jgi:DNA (cytosine-5)-methyltransferase 1
MARLNALFIRCYRFLFQIVLQKFVKLLYYSMRILNLYACLGGNRYKWDEVADIEVTAVERDYYLSELYQERFPNDKVIVADAHEFLLNNYKDFDFIWSSPPCPTHSRARYWGCKNGEKATKPVYPDMQLYQEILFLENYYNGKWCVENVIPYYEPLKPAQKRGRHLYWTNFKLPKNLNERNFKISNTTNEVDALSKFHDYDFRKYLGYQRRDKIARNLVDYEAGKTILETACGIIQKEDVKQLDFFD